MPSGSQEPRFWSAPPRHRKKEPGCETCSRWTGGIYARIGCGDYAATELLREWAPYYGYLLDPWQRWWLTEATGVRPDGRWAAFEVAGIVSRQNGKNTALEIRELGGLFLFGESMIIHTAHEFKAAAEHFRRVRDTITNYNELSARVKRVMTSHGDEAIELKPVPTLIFGSNGTRVRKSVTARLRFLARSRGSGRSFTADCVVYDEAMFLTDEQVGASMPTMSAVPNPQMWYTASAGYKDSIQLAMVRRRIMRGDPTVMGAEWSIDPHLETCHRDEVHGRRANHFIVCDKHDDRDKPESWAKANPAYGARISAEHVAKEFAAMSPMAFDRERLGVGDWPSDEEPWSVISEDAWQQCVMDNPGGTVRPIAFAVDVNPEMTVTTIAAAWERPQHDGEKRVVLEIPRGCSREGTAWVIPRLQELRVKWKPVAIVMPRNGAGAGLINKAEQVGLEVLVAVSSDEAAAFTQLVTAVRNKAVIHLGKAMAPALWQAVATAETRDIGDGGRGWSRRDSGEDITPLTAVTLAHWGLIKRRRSYDILRSIG